jgi:predicted kinase
MIRPKTVVAVAGLPTSGKTALALKLSELTGLHYVDIDAGPASCTRPPQPDQYSSEEGSAREALRMQIAYRILHEAVEANLAAGLSVIISATYSRHSSQDFLSASVERGGGVLKMILCTYDDTPEEVERRIKGRLAKGYFGGCRSIGHYRDDKGRYAGIKLPHIVVRMEGGVVGTLKAAAQALEYVSQE